MSTGSELPEPDSIPPCSTITASEEGIASNILADRLQHPVAVGVLTRTADPTHKQKQIYSLTEMGIQLLPVFIALGAWGRRFLPATEALSIRAELLKEGGNRLLRRFMAELRAEHLHGESVNIVHDELRAAYEKARTKEQRGAARRGSRSSKAERRSG